MTYWVVLRLLSSDLTLTAGFDCSSLTANKTHESSIAETIVYSGELGSSTKSLPGLCESYSS